MYPRGMQERGHGGDLPSGKWTNYVIFILLCPQIYSFAPLRMCPLWSGVPIKTAESGLIKKRIKFPVMTTLICLVFIQALGSY